MGWWPGPEKEADDVLDGVEGAGPRGGNNGGVGREYVGSGMNA